MEIYAFRNLIYELYKIDWEKNHPEADKRQLILEMLANEDERNVEDCLFEDGYHGSLYVCFEEFLETEYKDKEYIKTLLGNDEKLIRMYEKLEGVINLDVNTEKCVPNVMAYIDEKMSSLNTKITYQYRNASNYKTLNQAVLKGTLTLEQTQKILSLRDCGENFIPYQVGLPEDRGEYPLTYEDDHIWFELDGDDFESTYEEPTIETTCDDLYQNFLKIKNSGWNEIEAINRLEKMM